MNGKTIAIVAAAGVLIVGGVLIWLAVTGGNSGTGDAASPAPRATFADRSENIVAVDRVGQAADGGVFDPLTIPAGLTSGVGADIPEDQLTQPGADLGVGDLIITNLYQSDASANPYVLLVVDGVTEPLKDSERSSAFASTGVPDDGVRVVQKVTLRLRQIAGSGDMAGWYLAKSVMPLNLQLESMTVLDISNATCGAAKTPLAGHDGTTNDTVQACFFVFGSVNTPASPISSLAISVRMAGKTQQLYIQSNAGQDLSVGNAHEADHDHEWWQTDPVTGLPIVDPQTGKVVPKEGHEAHEH